MSEYNRSAEKRISELASKAAVEFDSTIIHNRVYETVDARHNGELELIRTLDLAESAYDLSHETETDSLNSAAFAAAEELNDVVGNLVKQQIAKACAAVILDGDAWTDVWEQEDIDAAQHEAREWLQTHQADAERAGVWKEVQDA